MIELNPGCRDSTCDPFESGFGQVTGLQHVVGLNPGCRASARDRAGSGLVAGLQHVILLNPGSGR